MAHTKVIIVVVVLVVAAAAVGVYVNHAIDDIGENGSSASDGSENSRSHVSPSRATWTLSIPADGSTQTWYIDNDAHIIKIVERNSESDSVNVQEFHDSDGTVYSYSELDPDLDITVPVSACDDADLDGNTCDEYVAELQEAIDSMKGVESKAQCTGTPLPGADMTIAERFPCDGVARVGLFVVDVVDCVPAFVLDAADNSVIATIDSALEGFPASVTLTGCADEFDDVEGRRNLGWINTISGYAEKTVTNSDWCGANNELDVVCPGEDGMKGDIQDNRACRRHDHGIAQKVVNFATNRLECKVDHELIHHGDLGQSIDGTYGKWGLSMIWGCYNYKEKTNCAWEYDAVANAANRECDTKWGWEVKFGPSRYDNMTDRSEMCDDIPDDHLPNPAGAADDEHNFHEVGVIWKCQKYTKPDKTCPGNDGNIDWGQGEEEWAYFNNWSD